MRYDFNVLERRAKELIDDGRQRDAGDLAAAKFWYGRAVEENPEGRLESVEARRRLQGVTIDDLVPPLAYLIP